MSSASDLFDNLRGEIGDRPQEWVGTWARRSRVFGFARATRIVPVEKVWRIGVLLIGEHAVFGVGEVLRTRTEAVRGYTATAQRERAERAAAAARGGFADGEIVHLDAERLDLDALDRGEPTGPLLVIEGVVRVRWSALGSPRPLRDYLDEQLAIG